MPGSTTPPRAGAEHYTLLDASADARASATPGTLGGHRRSKIYGRLDCPAAARAIAAGGYLVHRVFFADEPTAVAAGYRPCAVCLPEAYRTWKHRTRTATVNERRSSTRGERHMSPLENARPETRLPAADLERARRWYHDKLGLTPTEERDGGLMYRLAGGVFCLFRSQGRSEGTFTQLALNVDDIDAVVAELRSRGVEFERLDIPGFTTVNDIVEVSGNYPSKGTRERGAFFRDSEGNMIALGQSLR